MAKKKNKRPPSKADQVNTDVGKVLICSLHTGQVETEMYRSTATLCLVNPFDAIRGVHTIRTARSFNGRNESIRAFLDSPADWLLWIDSDMSFSPEAFARLYAEAITTPEAKIVAGLCFMYDTGDTTIFPNIFFQQEDGHYEPTYHYKPDSRFWCDATGVAFVMIHREVFEAIGDPWHQNWIVHPETGFPMAHDISFFHEARKHGYRVRYCADAKVTHVKKWAIGEENFIQQLKVLGIHDEWVKEES